MNPLPLVLIDASAIPGNVGGVGRYVEELLRCLDSDDRFRYAVVARPDAVDGLRSVAPHVDVITTPGYVNARPLRMLWEQLGLPRIANRLGASVIFSPHYTMPVFARVPVVVALHDATFFSDPRVHGRLKRVFFRAWSRYSLRHAARCVVPSAATADALSRYVRVPRARMVVIHHGVDLERFHPPTAAERDAAAKLVGSKHWIAFLGTLEPRKNVGALVRAFSQLPGSVLAQFPDLGLVLAGAPGWDTSLDSEIAASARPDRIRRLGYVEVGELAGLLGGALVVCYPSLGEGFGLPVLEAMASGAAVLTTRRLALPEVGGDSVEYSEPDERSLAVALAAMLEDSGERARLARSARARAEQFTWQSTAAAHSDVFAEVRADYTTNRDEKQ